MQPVRNFPEWKNGEPQPLEELARIDELVRRVQTLDVDCAMQTGPGGLTLSPLASLPPRAVLARLVSTSPGAPGIYDWSEVAWDAVEDAYAPAPDALDSAGTGPAREINGVPDLPADPSTGLVVWLTLADDGESWEFAAASPPQPFQGGAVPDPTTFGGLVTANAGLTANGPAVFNGAAAFNNGLAVQGGDAVFDVNLFDVTALSGTLNINLLTLVGVLQAAGIVVLPGPRPAAPAPGAVWHDGIHLWFFVGGVWQQPCWCAPGYFIDPEGTLELGGDGGASYFVPPFAALAPEGSMSLGGDGNANYFLPPAASLTPSGTLSLSGSAVVTYSVPPSGPTTSGLLVDLDASGTLWQDTARTIAANANGNPVGTWDNAGSAPVRFQQATAANRPTWQTNVLNGLPVVRANGTTQNLASTAPIDLSGTSAVTVIAVVKQNAAAAAQIYEHSTSLFGGTDRFLLGYNASGFAVANMAGNVGSSNATSASGHGGAWHVISGVLDKTLTSGEATIWMDRVQGTRPFDSNNTGGFSSQTGYLFSRAGTSLFLGGDIARFLLFNRALTPTERADWETFLKNKYGTA